MKVHFGGRLFLVAAVVGVAAVFAVGLLVALGVRSVVAGPGAAAPTPVGHEWSQVEGHGTGTGLWWLGTTANNALELRVNGARALRLEPNATSPNVIAGYSGNSVTAGAVAATIGGGGSSGYTNRVTDDYGAVGGGGNNQAGIEDANPANQIYATVAGGFSNLASGNYSTIGGGDNNETSGSQATVGGGYQNTASASYSSIGGGDSNLVTDDYSTVCGGYNNRAGLDDGNTVNQAYATVAGGVSNTASGDKATVGGGNNNTASGDKATVGGGWSNTASGWDDTVGGGESNTASGGAATVGGGQSNNASGSESTIPGGHDNTASGSYTFAVGYQANATHNGSFVWSSSETTSSYNTNTFTVRSHGGAKFYTASGTGTGVVLSAGGNSWNNLSDRDQKENFTPVDGQDVLASLAEIPMSTWNLKSQDPSIRHMGPMAQDFSAAFGLGEDERYIGTLDADGVALAAIQGLYGMVQDLQAENADLEARVTALEGGAGTSAASAEPAFPGLSPWWLALGGLVVVGLVVVQRRRAGGRP